MQNPTCIRLHLTTACIKRVPVTKRLSKPIYDVTKFSASMLVLTANHMTEKQQFGKMIARSLTHANDRHVVLLHTMTERRGTREDSKYHMMVCNFLKAKNDETQ